MVSAAIADGRHGQRWQTVCDGCHQWVQGIYWTSLDRKRYCFKCVCGLFPNQPTDDAGQLANSAEAQ